MRHFVLNPLEPRVSKTECIESNIQGRLGHCSTRCSFTINPFKSYEVASESEITPCIKIDKPLVVYRFSGNVIK